MTAADPPGSAERTRLAQILVSRGEARELSGSLTGALSDFQKALIAFQRRARENAGNPHAQMEAARCHLSVARLSARVGLPDQAAANFEKALGIDENHLEERQERPQAQQVAAEAYAGLGNIANARGSNLALPPAERMDGFQAARSYYRKSLDLRQSVNKSAPPSGGVAESDAKRLTARIAECDRQLARLNGGGTSQGRRRQTPQPRVNRRLKS